MRKGLLESGRDTGAQSDSQTACQLESLAPLTTSQPEANLAHCRASVIMTGLP